MLHWWPFSQYSAHGDRIGLQHARSLGVLLLELPHWRHVLDALLMMMMMVLVVVPFLYVCHRRRRRRRCRSKSVAANAFSIHRRLRRLSIVCAIFGLNDESFNHSLLWTTKLNGCIRVRVCVRVRDRVRVLCLAQMSASHQSSMRVKRTNWSAHACAHNVRCTHTSKNMHSQRSFDCARVRFVLTCRERNPPASKRNGVHLLWLSMSAPFRSFVRSFLRLHALRLTYISSDWRFIYSDHFWDDRRGGTRFVRAFCVCARRSTFGLKAMRRTHINVNVARVRTVQITKCTPRIATCNRSAHTHVSEGTTQRHSS